MRAISSRPPLAASAVKSPAPPTAAPAAGRLRTVQVVDQAVASGCRRSVTVSLAHVERGGFWPDSASESSAILSQIQPASSTAARPSVVGAIIILAGIGTPDSSGVPFPFQPTTSAQDKFRLVLVESPGSAAGADADDVSKLVCGRPSNGVTLIIRQDLREVPRPVEKTFRDWTS